MAMMWEMLDRRTANYIARRRKRTRRGQNNIFLLRINKPQWILGACLLNAHNNPCYQLIMVLRVLVGLRDAMIGVVDRPATRRLHHRSAQCHQSHGAWEFDNPSVWNFFLESRRILVLESGHSLPRPSGDIVECQRPPSHVPGPSGQTTSKPAP